MGKWTEWVGKFINKKKLSLCRFLKAIWKSWNLVKWNGTAWNYTTQLFNIGIVRFCRKTHLEGIIQIALIGSLTTNKAKPKDADVLVTIDESVDMEKLAEFGRKLKGRTQSINSGADIFLINAVGEYLGRTCSWRECRPGIRMSCQAMNCGWVPYLYDNLQIIKLSKKITANPPLLIYPEIIIKNELPKDLINQVEQMSGNSKMY